MTKLTIRPGYMLVQGKKGDFDSRNRHVREVANTAEAEFWMTQGPTIAIQVRYYTNSLSIAWRYECGPRSITPQSPFTSTFWPAAGFTVSKPGALS